MTEKVVMLILLFMEDASGRDKVVCLLI